MSAVASRVGAELAGFVPEGERERRDWERLRALAGGDGARPGNPWLRSLPLHLTASALVVHPPSGRLLLRWHVRQQRWLHVGGHGDPGDTSAYGVAAREAVEETGLGDLRLLGGGLVHVAIVEVAAGRGEPAHLHGDLRYVLATESPEQARPEDGGAKLRWASFPEALAEAGDDSLAELITRAEALVKGAPEGRS